MQYLSLEAARAAKCQVDVKRYRPVTPASLGTHVVEVGIEELIPFIDWKPFFEVCRVHCIRWVVCSHSTPNLPFLSQVWQLRGKYPNRGYPKIFQGICTVQRYVLVIQDLGWMEQCSVSRRFCVPIAPSSAWGTD